MKNKIYYNLPYYFYIIENGIVEKKFEKIIKESKFIRQHPGFNNPGYYQFKNINDNTMFDIEIKDFLNTVRKQKLRRILDEN